MSNGSSPRLPYLLSHLIPNRVGDVGLFELPPDLELRRVVGTPDGALEVGPLAQQRRLSAFGRIAAAAAAAVIDSAVDLGDGDGRDRSR